jgi:hypothetical protein
VAHVQTRPRGHAESFVDDALIAQMLMTIAGEEKPHTLVLLTGDGNDNNGRASFVGVVTIALKKHWTVEVWAWRASVSSRYKNLLAKYVSAM